MNKTIKIITSLAGIVGLCFSIYFFVDERYALAAEMKKIEQRLEYKIIGDQYDKVQDRIWKLNDRLKGTNSDKPIIEEIRELELQKEHIKSKMQSLETK